MSAVSPTYDDLPEVRYHFPKRYLRLAESCRNDWILYYEPRQDGGRMAYFATARVTRIEPDPVRSDHYYAYVSDYLEFPNSVPYKEGATFWESALRKADGSANKGLLGWAIHNVPDSEYEAIVARGLGGDLDLTVTAPSGVREDGSLYGVQRDIQIISRPLRDRAFTRVVQNTYASTCAMTGLRLVNGGGHCEIESAHILPVENDGPDSIRNGVALSRTIHWMFDRGIASLEDDGKILKADKLIPSPLLGLFNRDGYARFPDNAGLRPHPLFLKYHRDHFKG